MNRSKNRWVTLRESFEKNEQSHIFQFCDSLTAAEKSAFFGQLAAVDLAPIRREVLKLKKPSFKNMAIRPASCIRLPVSVADEQRWNRAFELGEDLIVRGKVGVVTLAGGQGTRLGFDHSKGLLEVTPVRKKNLFQVLAEKIAATERRYQHFVPWLIMTSEMNYGETLEFFETHQYFGLRAVHILAQNSLPTVDSDGKLLLSAKNAIAMHPDGHGGFFQVFSSSGLMDEFCGLGVEHLSFVQIDNPLIHPIDPYFIGFHAGERAEVSSRCVKKAYADEKVGVFVERDGKLAIVEYADMPADLMQSTDISSHLRFGLANIAAHVVTMSFIQDFCKNQGWNDLPLHRALRRVPFLNESGKLIRPTEANGVKLERFLFDILPLASRTLLLEGRREELFSPIKSLVGLDSLETARRDQIRLWAQWLSEGKADMPLDSNGLPPFSIEISPLFADSKRHFLEAWRNLTIRPAVRENFCLD